MDESMEVVIAGPDSDSISDAEYWQYTPRNPGSFTLSITVKDRTGIALESASRPVFVLAVPSSSDLRHLSIGDSITRAGNYAEFAVVCVLGGKLVGTRTYDGGIISQEGRGGWTLNSYITRIARPEGGDSPFLFPLGVEGDKFLGNTSFWKDVTAADPRGYDYSGFQMIARGWRTMGNYHFNAQGYPNSPASGDVIVDPNLMAEEQWQQYNGSGWQVMMPPPNVEVSFAKYIDRYSSAFGGRGPTSISIMLGTVDFLSALSDESWSIYKTQLDAMISSIREWDPEVPIILIGSPSGAPAAMWADQKVDGADFDRRMLQHSQRLYGAFDTPECLANGIHVISFLGVVSGDNMADYVHPEVPEGHDQMGPWL
ncbi:SGNH/GDSL hydrolase family protein [Mycolicibacterium vanbaalenii]|nr:SGNH/GDSL hydrolase family protein [Mycolicibacterium vanbaalenii]